MHGLLPRAEFEGLVADSRRYGDELMAITKDCGAHAIEEEAVA